MNNKEIDEARGVAKNIMKSNPKLAFYLISMCLKYRPQGEYLLSKFIELKELLNIKTFVVLGNCQSLPISGLIEFKNSNLHVVSTFREFEMRNINEVPPEFYYVDHIITQNLSHHFGVFSTGNLKSLFLDKITVIPSCFFKGEHPDWNYFNHIGSVSDNINRFQSPIGDYHNQTIYESFIDGLDVKETLVRLNSYEYNKEKYGHLAEESINELRRREEFTDIDISDFIWSNFKSGKSLFHSFNHPKKAVLNELVNRVLTSLKLEHNKLASSGECLDWDIQSGNILIGKRTPIIKKGQVYNEEQFVKDSFEIYRKLQSQTQ